MIKQGKKYLKKFKISVFEIFTLIISIIALVVSIGSLVVDSKAFEYSLKALYDAKIDLNNNTITITNLSNKYSIVKVDVIESNYMEGYLIDTSSNNKLDSFGDNLYIKYNAIRDTKSNKLIFAWNDSKANELLDSLSEYMFASIDNMGNFWISPAYYIMIEYQDSYGNYKKDYFFTNLGFTRREAIATGKSKNYISNLNENNRLSIDEYNYALQNQYIYEKIDSVNVNTLVKKLGI